jgi:hypothetical protein
VYIGVCQCQNKSLGNSTLPHIPGYWVEMQGHLISNIRIHMHSTDSVLSEVDP